MKTFAECGMGHICSSVCVGSSIQPVSEVVYGEVTVQTSKIHVEANGKKLYHWKDHGLKLDLPPRCTASFILKTVTSSRFELPKNTEQLSPVYWVESTGDLRGPAILEMQHSAELLTDAEQAQLRFAVSKVEQGDHSRKFELREGQFGIGSYGKLEIKHFSTWEILIVRLKSAFGISKIFLANLYYQRVSPFMCLIHFIVVPRQKAWEKVKRYNCIL